MLDGDIYAQLYHTHSVPTTLCVARTWPKLSANYAILVFLGTSEKHHF